MKAFFRFIASPLGRWIRIIAGAALIVIGLVWVKGTIGWILFAVGLVPLAAGIFDWCVFAPLFRLPFLGPRLRQSVMEDQKMDIGSGTASSMTE
jgi:hypothetical protein